MGSGTKPKYEYLRTPTSLGITIRGWRRGWKIKRLFLEQRIDQLQEVEKRLRDEIAELRGEASEPLSHLTIIAAKQNHVPGSGWGEERHDPSPSGQDSSELAEVVVPSSA